MCKYELVFTILINLKLRLKSMYMSFGGLLAPYGHGWSLVLLRGAKLTFFLFFFSSTKSMRHLSSGTDQKTFTVSHFSRFAIFLNISSAELTSAESFDTYNLSQ